jgi:hypothetical protein
LEGGDSFLQLAVIAQLLAVVHDRGGSLKTNPLKGCPIAQIFRLEVVGLLEESVGRLVVLASLGVLALGVKVLGVVGDGWERYGGDQQQE